MSFQFVSLLSLLKYVYRGLVRWLNGPRFCSQHHIVVHNSLVPRIQGPFLTPEGTRHLYIDIHSSKISSFVFLF